MTPQLPSASRTRPLLLWGGLLATLAATGWAALMPETDDEAVVAAVRTSGLSAAAGPSRAIPPEARQPQARTPWPAPTPHALAAWGEPTPAPRSTPPRVVAVAPEPPPPAAAPAPPQPPYQWVGRIEEDGRPRALLASASRTVLIGRGEVLDGQWRVEDVGPAALALLWLPGGVRQNLVLGR